VTRMIPAPLSLRSTRSSSEDLGLDRDVERGGRLVCDQAGSASTTVPSRSITRGACRRRTRADRSARGSRERGMPTRSISSTARSSAAAFEISWSMHADLLGDLAADPLDRIERADRVLEDHRDPRARIPAAGRCWRGSARRPRSGRCPEKALGERVRPIRVIEVTDLPEPDSRRSPRPRRGGP